MYKATSESKQGFLVETNVNGNVYMQDAYQKEGISPIAYINIGLSGCVIMYARSYFIKYHNIDNIELKANSEFDYDNRVANIKLYVNTEISEEEAKRIVDFIHNSCKVEILLRGNFTVNIELIGK